MCEQTAVTPEPHCGARELFHMKEMSTRSHGRPVCSIDEEYRQQSIHEDLKKQKS